VGAVADSTDRAFDLQRSDALLRASPLAPVRLPARPPESESSAGRTRALASRRLRRMRRK
jgi:hypothetical protein